MAKKTILENVRARMKELQDSKTAQLETIQQKQAEARSQIEAAALAMKQATEDLNVDSYEEAKNRKRKAQTALDMYNGRYEQIKAQEYISEEESDAVVDSLLEYEEELAANFRAALAVRLKDLAALLREYQAEVNGTEDTLSRWQSNIHANYNTRGFASYYDEFTGQYTSRSPQPVPVHRMPYQGCNEAARLESYIDKEAELLASKGQG